MAKKSIFHHKSSELRGNPILPPPPPTHTQYITITKYTFVNRGEECTISKHTQTVEAKIKNMGYTDLFVCV
jgi:hypothetical protein